MEIASGIDFGTSNSTVAYSVNGVINIVDVENGNNYIPTALFFFENSNKKIYGNNAINTFLSHENGRLVQSIKSILGTSLMDEVVWINNKHVYCNALIEYFITHLKYKLDKQANRQVDAVAKKLKMTEQQRWDFGDYIEAGKGPQGGGRGGADNYTWNELINIGKEFLNK